MYRFKRHSFTVRAHLVCSLVLAYAVPAHALERFLVPGLVLDTYEGFGFFVIALVQTQHLRPAFFPAALGLDFRLSGYRVFVRTTTAAGRTLRGLRVVRSDTDRRVMETIGNAMTHYNYQLSQWTFERTPERLEIGITTPGGVADLHVIANLASTPETPPAGSPFPDLKTARRFAGPMPFTFDYEAQTHSLLRVEGVRTEWTPRPVDVEVRKASFLERLIESGGVPPVLANAFFLEDVPYLWRRGVRERVSTPV